MISNIASVTLYVEDQMKARNILDRPKSMKWGTFAQFYDPDGYVHFLKQINP